MVQHTAPSGWSDTREDSATSEARALRTAALVFGVIFLVVGVAGFVPGLTSNLDDLEFAGHESGAELLGLFQVSVLHNLVHVLFGVAGIVAARHWTSARSFLIVGGIAYLGLLVYGVLVDHDADANFVPLNDADNWLHLGLGISMLGLGLALRPRAHHVGEVDRRTDSAEQATNFQR